jgi:hypothetical protein
MKPNPAVIALCLLGVSLPCLADTFKMKDGTTLEGVILSTSPDSYVVQVQVTKSIKDERTIAKADIEKIIREEPDAKAFEPLAKLVPTPDMLTAEEYATQISNLEKFIKAHPTGASSRNAKAMLETLKSESAQVSAGGIKFNGQMISPADYQANAYDLDARIQEAKIRRFIAAGQFLSALRSFVTFDRDYRNTASYEALLAPMKQVIEHQVSEAKQSLATLDARTKEQMVGLQRMALADRKATEDAIASERAELEALYKSEKDAKQSWPTTSPFHKVSLEDTVKFGQAELIRLGAVKPVLGVDAGKSYREAWMAVRNGGADKAAATAALASAKAAGVPPRYLAPLEATAKMAK